MTKLRKQLETVLMEYIRKFEKKHDTYFEFAVNDELMGVISFGDMYYFHVSDIIYDIDNKLKKRLIFRWLEDNVDAGEGNYINLHSYAKGLRHKKSG